MALVVSSSSSSSVPPDPTATLQVALRNFESALTTEQRQLFNTQVQHFNQQKPDASSVIQFVAQIDAVNHVKARTSVSNRLCTFLDATRQFTDIISTFVSSNPVLAALIWGGVKTTVLIVSNVASYFDKVASMIMAIGQMCPIYREFSHLYSDSAALQQALCEYYTIVVRLITRIVQVSQRTVINSILSSVVSPFESEFGPLQSELAAASQKVKLQISLAAKQAAHASAKLVESSARLVELERRANKQHRIFTKALASEIRAEHDAARQLRIQDSARSAAKMRLYIKDQLSTINHQVPWKQAQRQRLNGTAEWFRREQDFQAWEAAHSATLWCPGRMGSGKTVLMSNIVAYLHLSLKPGDLISFHFCRSENAISLLARSIMGALARQILDLHITDADETQLQSLYDTCRDIDTAGLVDLLLTRLETTKTYYFIVDGLDECDEDQITELAQSMARLYRSQRHGIKIIYSGRPELEFQLFHGAKAKYRLPLSKTLVSADIEHYVDTELDECLQEGKIKLTNPETIWSIRDTLLAQHDGLILFVRLFIEEICTLGNESAILKALKNPPRGVSDLLTIRLHRVRDHSLAADAMKILQYCGCTKRPLTVNEFGELLSVSLLHTSLDRASVPQNMDQIIAACCGLIYVEEEEATIHYVHHSLKHHLFTSSSSQQEGFVETETDAHLGYLCLTYLNFNDFKRQLRKTYAASNKPVAPIEIGLVSVQDYSSTINDIARRLLKARRASHRLTTAELSRRTEDILGEDESSRLKAELESRPFYLLDYVQTHWIWHSSRFDQHSKLWYHFVACVRGENDLARRPWIQDSDLQQAAEANLSASTTWAFTHNHEALLLHDLLYGSHTIPPKEMSDILLRAIKSGNDRLVYATMLPNHRSVIVVQNGLYWAARHGNIQAMDWCIEFGADVNAGTDGGPQWTALQVAAERGHVRAIERLLAADADVNAAKYGGHSALSVAAREGHVEVVERLLAAGADVNPATHTRQSALQAAAAGGHLKVVERLLVAGTDVNTATLTGYSALYAAAEAGHVEVVERLLAAGALVNSVAAPIAVTDQDNLPTLDQLIAAGTVFKPHSKDASALSVAAGKGHLQVVKQLIAVHTNTNTAAETGFRQQRTALQAAADSGHLEVVKLLLEKGRFINGPSTLKSAAEEGALAMVELLISAEVDVNATSVGHNGRTALLVAAEAGHVAVVKRLLAAGANLNAADDHGNFALSAAAYNGHLEVVERLIMAGANVSTWHGPLALRAAEQGGHTEVIERLELAGAARSY